MRTNDAAKLPYQSEEGAIFGTVYHVKYQYGSSLHADIMERLLAVDSSLSMFNKQSTVSARR